MKITIDKDLGIIKIGEDIYYGQDSVYSEEDPCNGCALNDLCNSFDGDSPICEHLDVGFFTKGPILAVNKIEISSLTQIPEKNIVLY